MFTYLIINSSEVNKVDFTKVANDSEQTLRKSLDKSLSLIKWSGATPSFVDNLISSQGPYNHSQILDILYATQSNLWVSFGTQS